MRIKVEPKRCVRLKGRGIGAQYTSTKGEVYDLDALDVPQEERERLLKTPGVTEAKDTPPAKQKGGDK